MNQHRRSNFPFDNHVTRRLFHTDISEIDQKLVEPEWSSSITIGIVCISHSWKSRYRVVVVDDGDGDGDGGGGGGDGDGDGGSGGLPSQ
ncbi:hypothetical protein HZH66_011802 [Vespula vulgaris]|uniref:Uncharacterized protein n=1 Tax=Vespula vulgaris TaxID=7454 RepID=A0A834JDE3_VESVU|nr:hypothetical protein HZH66_011802 [Vespula vulgaris]